MRVGWAKKMTTIIDTRMFLISVTLSWFLKHPNIEKKMKITTKAMIGKISNNNALMKNVGVLSVFSLIPAIQIVIKKVMVNTIIKEAIK